MFLHLPVSHSVHVGGGGGFASAPVHAGIHPPDQRQTPPCTVHAGRYGQQAGGTHPTGMHPCQICWWATDIV